LWGSEKSSSNVAAIFFKVVMEHPTIQTVLHDFLEVGCTHFECNSGHACIKRARKGTSTEIRVSHDQHLFVQSVRWKSTLKVVGVKQKKGPSFFISVRYVH
jgi:hypothetical protein